MRISLHQPIQFFDCVDQVARCSILRNESATLTSSATRLTRDGLARVQVTHTTCDISGHRLLPDNPALILRGRWNLCLQVLASKVMRRRVYLLHFLRFEAAKRPNPQNIAQTK